VLVVDRASPVLLKTSISVIKQQKILVVRFSSIGDIILTTPVIRAVKQQLNAEVHFLVKQEYAVVVRQNPYIDQIQTLQKQVSKTAADLKKENYSLVIDLQKNAKSWWLTKLLGVETIRFDKFNIKKWVTVRLKWNALPAGVHLIDRYFEALAPIGVVNDGEGLDFYILPEDDYDALELVKGMQYQVLVLGATYETKRIPKEKCLEIIMKSRLQTVLLGGRDVASLAEEICAHIPEKTVNFCGRVGLGVSAGIIRYAERVISGDTGLMHISAALKKEIIVLWGNTIPAFGMFPYYGKNYSDKATQLEVKNLSCRPCSKLGYDRCPKQHFRCMREQVIPEELFHLTPAESNEP
jgi:ADP-heptose:LPS heptosyltransferase